MIRLLIAFIFLSSVSFAQLTLADITVHSRVDTTDKDVKEVLNVWRNYLLSKPDSIYDNPFWNSEEKRKFKDFDFTRQFIYVMPSSMLLKYYKPTVLSIVKEKDNYAIRTLFAADGLPAEYRKSNPWCITKIYALREDGNLKLKNALPVITADWNRKTIGKITFVYTAAHKFNAADAKKSVAFCDSVTKTFSLQEWAPFEFFITENGDEMGKLLGFDFYFPGYTTGMGMNENRMLFSGLASEWYPHELVHMIVPNKKRHSFVEEGFATWVGGSAHLSFQEVVKELASALAKNDTVTLEEVLNKKWGWLHNAYYASGAVFCKLVFEKSGKEGIKRLLNTSLNNSDLYAVLTEVLKVKEEELDVIWRKEVGRYIQ